MRFGPLVLSLAVGSSLAFTACKPGPRGAVASKGGDSAPALGALHHAAEEMALDAFQYGRPGIGWPADIAAKTAADYMSVASARGYLAAPLPAGMSAVKIANTAETDPMVTMLAAAPVHDRWLVVRKDGAIGEFPDLGASRAFAPLPPRDPEWLP